MKKLFTCFILFMTFGSDAGASEELTLVPIETTPGNSEVDYVVNRDQLKLLGRGVISKDGQSMALTCVDEACSKARMVLFESDRMTAWYVGRGFKLSRDGIAPSEAQIKAVLKELSNRYRGFRRNESFLRTMAFAVVGIGGVVGIATLTGSLPIFLGTTGAFLLLHQGNYYPSLGISAEHQVVATFESKKGWNWSSKPKKVSMRSFDALYGAALSY